MTIYVSMVKLTQEGVKGLRKWASTVDELKKVSLTMGVTIAGAYALVGPYDMMFISEADESTSGPASFMIADPDGNPVLFDQHV